MSTSFLPFRAVVVAVAVANLALAAACVAAAEPDTASAGADETEFAQQVDGLVRQLNDNSAARRQAAEAELLQLAGTTAATTDRLLAALPEESDQMPLAVRERLARIRRQVQDRAAKSAVTATTVTLAAKQMPLPDVFAAIERQTGNRFKDTRGDFGNAEATNQPAVTLSLENESYWPAVDQVLDQVGLGVYSYAGDDALAVVSRDEGAAPRYGQAVYSGPFRMEIMEVQAQRDMRLRGRNSLRIKLEVSWEPRLRPIAVSQAAAELTAVDATGRTLPVAQPDAMLAAEVPAGTQATELILSFAPPSREVATVQSLGGTLRTLLPGRQVKFRFDNLAGAAGKSQRVGGVEVRVDAVRRNNQIWEIHMRLRLDEDNQALESHRGWVFQNLSYLVNAAGETIDNAGLETTMQSRNEVGTAYFFDLPDGLDGLTWVYETPAAIVELPIEYEIKDIPLP
jgi:hypothetical protein